MAFNDSEASVEASQPLELFRVVIDTETFRWTTQEKPFTLDGAEYEAIGMERGGYAVGPETRRDTFEIRVPGDNPFAQKFAGMIPGTEAVLTAFRIQRQEGTDPDDVIQFFEGTVQSVAWVDNADVAVIGAQPIVGSFTAEMPRRNFGSGCSHILYDPTTCRVQESDSSPDLTPFRFDGTVSLVAGEGENTITVPGAGTFVDGWFTSGTLSAGGGADVRLIKSHEGDVLTLMAGFPFDITDAPVVLQAGCGHDPTTCATKFANFVNYGGFHAVPRRNVFTSGVV